MPKSSSPEINYGNIDLPTVLLSISKYDYNTPPELVQDVRNQFPSSRMIYYDGAYHCPYLHSPGLTIAVNNFFNTGALPEDGVHYPRVPFETFVTKP
jgi:pimeloyl-ACP methyl ester carboxylesterase